MSSQNSPTPSSNDGENAAQSGALPSPVAIASDPIANDPVVIDPVAEPPVPVEATPDGTVETAVSGGGSEDAGNNASVKAAAEANEAELDANGLNLIDT
jgi:hypothetical protein